MHGTRFQQRQRIGPAGIASELLSDGYNRLIQGDCLAVMAALPAASFNTIYIDPPFFTGKQRLMSKEAPAGFTYADAWEHGLAEYIDWLGERLTVMRGLLREDGALLVHLDWHAVHYVKVLLDRLFGIEHFQNEFIWYYSGGGASRQRFARKHDTILYYTKSAKEWKFYADRVRTPYRWTQGQPRADGSKRDYQRGKLPDDVWEQHALMPWAQEHLGYPTQKPEALLERLLLATTDEGDTVGDFFCGSGTTAATAQRLGRRWVTTDASREAVCLTAERIAEFLVPGCVTHTERRARARAHARFERLAAATHLGLDDATLAACALTRDYPGTGFAVEEQLDSSVLSA